MAVPTVVRETDYPSVDYSNTADAAFEILRDTIVNKLNWNLEFEDLTSEDKSFVVSNNGSGYAAKIINLSSQNRYLKIETAQSWSDLNSPIGKMDEQYFDTDYFKSYFLIAGDDKRFYISFINQLDTSKSNYGLLIFLGDMIPIRESDPNVFCFIGQNTPLSTTKSSSTSKKGRLLEDVSPNMISATVPFSLLLNSNPDGTKSPYECGIISPGFCNYSLSSLDVTKIETDQPVILNRAFVTSTKPASSSDGLVNGTYWANNVHGVLPGLLYLNFPCKKLSAAECFTTVSVSGVNVVNLPPKYFHCTAALSLNDWELI